MLRFPGSCHLGRYAGSCILGGLRCFSSSFLSRLRIRFRGAARPLLFPFGQPQSPVPRAVLVQRVSPRPVRAVSDHQRSRRLCLPLSQLFQGFLLRQLDLVDGVGDVSLDFLQKDVGVEGGLHLNADVDVDGGWGWLDRAGPI